MSQSVCYYLRYYPTLTETFVYREVEALQARGLRARAVAIGRRADGEHARSLPDWSCRFPPSYLKILWSILWLLCLPRTWMAMIELSRHQPLKQVLKATWAASTLGSDELVHVHFAGEAAEWALLAHRVRRVPYGVTVHAVDLFRPRPSLQAVLDHAEVVVTISEYNASLLRERYGCQPQVVRCGVLLEQWQRARPEGDGPIVAVGRWVPKKGLDLLVEAVQQLPGAQLEIVGDAPAEIEGDGVRVLGPLPTREIAKVLARGALFALPCRVAPGGDRDGIPVAMMEAMASGLPVVTTSLPGLGELVDERCGWVVPPEDLPQLREALRAALASPEERKARGQTAYERVASGYTVQAQAEGVLRAWSHRLPSPLPQPRIPR